MIELLPSKVNLVEAKVGAVEETLPPAEAALVAGTHERCRREFAGGRMCARKALAAFGLGHAVILAGPRGEPLWPPGIVGSITHRLDYCAAAVASSGSIAGIGIDAELNRPLSEGASRRVCTPQELSDAGELEESYAATVIFSAKECVFKAWYPATRRELGYRDVRISLSPDEGTFEATLHAPLGTPSELLFRRLSGRFSVGTDLLFTAVVVKA
jgi:4'-phosphopantetheinyl transferase EntD